jgi:hypothetical protein
MILEGGGQAGRGAPGREAPAQGAALTLIETPR